MASTNDRFIVRYWGVRGSIPVPGPQTVRYGGNTTCIEVRCGDQIIVIDTGTGARELGTWLQQEAAQRPLNIHLIYSHLHLDHVQGFPFFAPIYGASNQVSIRSLLPPDTLQETLQLQMAHPSFPVELDKLAARLSYLQVNPGDSFQVGEAKVSTCLMEHPGGALGIRIDYKGHSFVQASDIEPEGGQPPPGLVELCRDADYLSYDSTYVEGEEYDRHKGWGHSTWVVGLKIAEVAGVKTFIAFHHDPAHDDEFMDNIASELALARRGSLVAYEGMTIDLMTSTVTLYEP